MRFTKSMKNVWKRKDRKKRKKKRKRKAKKRRYKKRSPFSGPPFFFRISIHIRIRCRIRRTAEVR